MNWWLLYRLDYLQMCVQDYTRCRLPFPHITYPIPTTLALPPGPPLPLFPCILLPCSPVPMPCQVSQAPLNVISPYSSTTDKTFDLMVNCVWRSEPPPPVHCPPQVCRTWRHNPTHNTLPPIPNPHHRPESPLRHLKWQHLLICVGHVLWGVPGCVVLRGAVEWGRLDWHAIVPPCKGHIMKRG